MRGLLFNSYLKSPAASKHSNQNYILVILDSYEKFAGKFLSLLFPRIRAGIFFISNLQPRQSNGHRFFRFGG